MTCGKTLGTSLSLGGWRCEGRRLTGLSMTLIPLESELLASTVAEVWVQETGDCKTREILHFL